MSSTITNRSVLSDFRRPTWSGPSVVPSRALTAPADGFETNAALLSALAIRDQFGRLRDDLAAELQPHSKLITDPKVIASELRALKMERSSHGQVDLGALHGRTQVGSALSGHSAGDRSVLVGTVPKDSVKKSGVHTAGSHPPKKKNKKDKSFIAKLGATLGASVLFAAFDYVGYNLSKGNPTTLKIYRAAQVTAQAALTYGLTKEFGWKTGAAFNAIWWTFGDDLLYYGIAEAMGQLGVVKEGSKWDGKGGFKGIADDKVTWAWWTPVGLLSGAKNGKPIDGNTLFIQAGVGLAVALSLLAWK